MERNITKRFNPEIEELKKRIANVKLRLEPGYRKQFFADNPEYDTAAGAELFNNVIYLKSTDKKITELLEEMVDKKKQAV
jgi:23S rRNA maturation mini-RNase III